jgi:hypothetical protein
MSQWPSKPVSYGPFVAFATLLFATLFVRPIHDVDIFWQLKLGELAIEKGGLVTAEPFLAPRLGEPLIPVAWLGQIADAAIYRAGKWKLLRFVDAVIWFGGLLAALPCLKGLTLRAPIFALVIGFLAAVPFHSIRPQSFAVLAFGLLIRLTSSDRSLIAKLALGVPLLVVWQNLHPSVVVGAIYLVCVTAAGQVKTIFRRQPPPWASALLMVAAGLATLATPAGPMLLEVSKVNGAISVWMRTGEWLPIWSVENRGACAGPALAILVAVGLAVRFRTRFRLETLLPAVAFAIMTCVALRFAVFFGVAVIPLLTQLLNEEKPQRAWHPKFGQGCSILFFLAVLAGPVSTAVPVRFADYYPFAGIEALKAANVSGPVYCHNAWGSLLPHFNVEWKPTHDGRHYLHSKAEWEQYFVTAAGQGDLDAILREFKPAAFFLRPGRDDGLTDMLDRHPEWRNHFRDSTSAIYLPVK